MNQNISKTAWITLAILGSTILIAMYGETMLLPAIPDIIRDFGISYNTSSWILSAYLISGAVATPIFGKLSDIYGRKKMVMIILVIYIVGIFSGGISPDITFLVISRVIQGIGISMFPIAFGIIRDQLPKDKLSVGVGIFSSMFAAGSVVGLGLGASIIENFGWRATFFSIVPVAVGLWFVIRKFIHDSPILTSPVANDGFGKREEETATTTNYSDNNVVEGGNKGNSSSRNLDIKGTVALAVTITSFLFIFSYSETDNLFDSPLIIILLCLGCVSLFLFIILERKSESPLVSLDLLTNKTILSANIILVVTFLIMFTLFQTIPVLVRSPQPLGFEGDATTAASIQLPFMVVFLLFAPSSGFIISKLGNIRPTILGSAISIIGLFSLFIFHSTEFLVSANLAIIAAGLSLTQVGGFNIVLETTPRQFSGISLGMTVLFNLVGGSIGPAFAGIYMQTHQAMVKGVSGSFPSSESYNLIFLSLALASLIPLVLAVFVRQRLASLSTSPSLKGSARES
ncbi:MAG TPA: MFS transporter [Nitrososphaeraceae archaeon]|nr:MFS transporter [Nitrososphaeraceae archaeon]